MKDMLDYPMLDGRAAFREALTRRAVRSEILHAVSGGQAAVAVIAATYAVDAARDLREGEERQTDLRVARAYLGRSQYVCL